MTMINNHHTKIYITRCPTCALQYSLCRLHGILSKVIYSHAVKKTVKSPFGLH